MVIKVLSLYLTKFIIHSARFMACSLSNLVGNMTDRIYKIKCKDLDCFLEYESVKKNLTKLNAYVSIKIIQTSLMKNEKADLKTRLSFLIMILINLYIKKKCLSLRVHE